MKKVEFQILIEKYAVGKCSPEEQLLVEKYFEECQNNPRAFSEESTVIGKRMFQKIVKTIGQKKRRTRQRIGFKIAASLLLLISAGSIIHLLNREEVYLSGQETHISNALKHFKVYIYTILLLLTWLTS